MTDVLTDLGNRRCLDDALPGWLEEARSGTKSFAVVLADVDHFKAFNDHYGHLAGDTCLRRIGAALRRVTRQGEDLVVRYGGEEFVILFKTASEAVAFQRANDLVNAIFALAIAHDARPDNVSRVTISAGLAFVPASTQTSPHAVIAAADVALYRAKHAGRGRVALAFDGEDSLGGREVTLRRSGSVARTPMDLERSR
nr:GGDEF domain-containing protein [Jiella flava]